MKKTWRSRDHPIDLRTRKKNPDRSSDLLTAIFFNGITFGGANDPNDSFVGTPTLSAKPNPVAVAPGTIPSAIYAGGATSAIPGSGNTELAGSPLNEWRLPNTPGNIPNSLTYGFGTAGFEVFTGNGGQQFIYGIAALPCNTGSCFAGANSQLTGSTSRFVRNSIVFELSGLNPAAFNLNNIRDVRFQFGTSLSEPSILANLQADPREENDPRVMEIPEPSTVVGVLGVALGGAFLRWSRK